MSSNLFLCCALAVFGGLHYGYNAAIVGTVLSSLSAELGISTLMGELLVSASTMGAIVGSPYSGVVADRYGRRVATIIGESLSVIGTVGCALGTDAYTLLACRFCVGLGVGFCTLCKPVYISEMAPSNQRSKILALFSPALALGILIAQSTDTVLHQWRLQLALGGASSMI